MCIANFYTSFIQLFVLTLQLECFQHKAFRVTPAITEAFGFFLLCLNPLAILKNNISSCFIFIRWLAGTLVTSQRSIQPPSIPKLQYQDGWLKKGNWLAVVWNLPSTRCLADFVLNKANISELREQHLVAVLRTQEHPSPIRWQDLPTFRSSFTIFMMASSRPRPMWSNVQSCCSGRRCNMQNT